jgi:hypothetical protein
MPARPAPGEDPQLWARRKAALKTETDLRDGGRLMALMAVLGLFGFVVWAAFVAQGSRPPTPATASALAAITLCLPQYVIGRSLATLRARSPWPARAISAIGLPFYPFGTLIGGWLLWLLRRPDALALLSDEHAALAAATPSLDPPRGNGPVILGVMLAFGMLAFGAFSAMVV